MFKKRLIVDIADAKVSNDPTDVLVTYALGSCIGVCFYDPTAQIGGMLHYQLPDSKEDSQRADERPLMFADTGVKLVVDRMVSMGAKKKRMQVKIAGGAATEHAPQGFNIGKRNQLAIKKVLWQNGMLIDAADIGGSSPRNMYMNIADGSVTVRCIGREKQLKRHKTEHKHIVNAR
jgi:chemotaxis protein CheD